jgi:hypothetical protein
MVMKKYILFFLCIGILSTSCINELDVETSAGVNILVVEGFISTAPGPHTVLLSRTAKFGNVFEGFAGPVEGAQVSVRDNEGNITFLTENETGVYQTPNTFQAEVGKAYTLLINTAEGVSYSSLPESVLSTPDIDTMYTAFEALPALEGDIPTSGVNVIVELEDDPEKKDYYRWSNSGTYEFNTRPDLFRNNEGQPAPKDCCATCYIGDLADESIRIADDVNRNGNRITEIVAFIEDDGLRFTNKYWLRLEQYAITEEAFQFFELLEEQLTISGDIFDPPPAKIGTNMINLDNPDEDVLGYFWASELEVDSMFITSTALDFEQPAAVIPDDCREVDGATLAPPFEF